MAPAAVVNWLAKTVRELQGEVLRLKAGCQPPLHKKGCSGVPISVFDALFVKELEKEKKVLEFKPPTPDLAPKDRKQAAEPQPSEVQAEPGLLWSFVASPDAGRAQPVQESESKVREVTKQLEQRLDKAEERGLAAGNRIAEVEAELEKLKTTKPDEIASKPDHDTRTADAGCWSAVNCMAELTAQAQQQQEEDLNMIGCDTAPSGATVHDPEAVDWEAFYGGLGGLYFQRLEEPVDWEAFYGNLGGVYPRRLDGPLVDPPPQSKEDVLVFSDAYGFCTEIGEQVPPGCVGSWTVQRQAADKYTEKGVKHLVSTRPWDLIVFALDAGRTREKKSARKHQKDVMMAFDALIMAIRGDASRCKRLAVLTVDCFAEEPEIHEECGLGLITNCTLFGMCNTARQEVQCPIQYIDTEWALRTENSKYICAEIFRHSSFGHNTVRILNKGRYVLRQVKSTPYEHKPEFQLPSDGVIAISGGNGALGLVMGLWILQKAQQQGGKKFSIQFLSRSCNISDQNMPNWKAIEALAAELAIPVEQKKCDCSKQEAVDEYIKEVTPNLTGFIHSAGILQDSMLFNQTWEKFDAVFEAKSRAALYLHDALERFENPGLEFFWMFSSCAVYGNMGQLNYSASNSFLDGLSRHRRAMGKVSMAPQWGAWGDVGMAANLDDASRRRMANSPMPYFSNAEGLWGLECGLRSSLPYFCVVKYNPPLMQGMVMGDDVPAQCYVRNFYYEIMPHHPGDPNKNPYSTYSYENRPTSHFIANGLVFQRHWPEIAEQLQEAAEF